MFHLDRTAVFVRLAVLTMLLLGLLIYGPSLPNPFIWDDYELIIHNPLVHGWVNLPRLFSGNIVEQSSFYRPLQMLSYVMDYEVWGLNPKGFHLTSILWHVAAALALCGFVAAVTRNRLSALLAGILFLSHPVHNEAVAYISGRADPIMAVFALLTITFYIRYLDNARLSEYLLCIVCFLAALMSKEAALIVPLLIGVYHVVFRKALNKELYFMLAVLALGYLGLRLLNVVGVADMHEKTSTILLQRLPGAFAAQALYVKILFFPKDLFMGYGQKLFAWHDPLVWSGLGLWGGMVSAAVMLRGRRPLVSFYLSWYVIALLPVMNLYPVNAYMAEHWVYLPAMGLLSLFAHMFAVWIAQPRWRPVAASGLMVVLIALSLTAHRQNYIWRDPVAFYQRIIRINPEYTKAYNNLGKILSQQGRYAEAADYFLRSITIDPRFVKGYHNYAVCMAKLDRVDEAVAYYHKALGVQPDFAPTYNNLGALYIDREEYDTAEKYVNRALILEPEMPKAFYNLGLIAQARQQNDRAREYFQLALKYDPNYAAAKNNLGSMMGREGDLASAISNYLQVLSMEPDNYTVMNNLGILYGRMGRSDKALEMFRSALQIKPDYADAHFNMAFAFANLKRWGQAMRHYQDAVRFDPGHRQAINNLAILYAQQNRFAEAERLFQRILELDPLDYSAHNNLGLVYAKQNKFDMAREQYNKALTINPAHKETHNNLGMLYDATGHMGDAEKHYLEALKVDPDFANALNGLGIVYGKQEKFKEAEGMFMRALKINPGRQDAINNLERARELMKADSRS